MALFLILFSYCFNFHRIGLLILFLHDPGDVVLIIARAYTDYKGRKVVINVIIYVITYILWVYTRNIVFPYCCIK